MTSQPPERSPSAEERISLFGIAATLLERTWLIVGTALIGAVLAVIPTFFAPALYTSSALVVSSASAPSINARLRGLAQSFGVGGEVVGNDLTAYPIFLSYLARSPVVLQRMAYDSLEVPELGEGRMVLADVLRSQRERSQGDEAEPEGELREGGPVATDSAVLQRRARGIGGRLARSITLTTIETMGSIRVRVSTEWPSVSLHVANRLLEELNRFNAEVSQERASDERRFVEGRVAAQERNLDAAEQELSDFLVANRQFRNSPDLTFEHDRLNRQVSLQQQLLVSLVQSLDQVRLREVRDVPVLQVIEPPLLALRPDGLRRSYRATVGFGIGGIVGLLLTGVLSLFAAARTARDPEVERFIAALEGVIAPVRAVAARLGLPGLANKSHTP